MAVKSRIWTVYTSGGKTYATDTNDAVSDGVPVSSITNQGIPEAPDATVTPTQVKTPTAPRNVGIDSSIGDQTSAGIYKDMWVWEEDDNTVYGAPRPDTNDTNKDFILGYDELWEAERQVYDMLSETEKKQFAAIGETARKAGYDMVKEQTTYLQRWKENQEFMQSQNDKITEIGKEQDNVATIAAQQRISQSATQLRNLKQNVAYLGTRGMPWVSLQSLDAITAQIARAEKLVQDVVATEGSLDRARRLGRDVEVESFTRKLKVLQDQLDDNVNESIQDAFNELTAAQMQGKLTSFSDFEALRIKLLNNLDQQIVGITDANINQRAFLIESYERIAKEQQEYTKWSKQIDKEQSATQGVWVDMNGNTMVSAETGAPIPFVKDSPIDPVYNDKTHELTEFFYNDEWALTARITKTMDDATFSQQTIAGIAKMVANKQLTGAQAEAIYPGITQMDAFRDSYNGADTGGVGSEDELARKEAYIKAYDKDPAMADRLFPEFAAWGDESGDQSDSPLAGKDVSNLILSGNVKALALSMEYDTPYECIDPATGRGAECGERYNDAVGIKNGTRVGDKYSDKTQFIDLSITQGEEGMGVVFNPGGWFEGYWHVGVLASSIYIKNGEAGYDVISSNYTAPGKLSKNFVPETLIANSGGGFIPTTATEEKKAEQVQQKSEIPVSDLDPYQQSILVARLGKQIYGTRISDAEWARVEWFIKEGMKQWKTEYEIIDDVLWYKITNEQYKPFAEQLRSTVLQNVWEDWLAWYDMIWVARLINGGQLKEAVKKIETTTYQNARYAEWEDYISESKVKTASQRGKELSALITMLEDSGENPIGRFDGTIQQRLGKFRSKDTQKIATDAAQMFIEMRNKIVGSNATEHEDKIMEPLIPMINDRTDNFLYKLENLRSEPLRELNNMRSTYWMPHLTEDELLDNALRVDLYGGTSGQTPPTNTQSPTKQPTSTNTTLTPEEQREIDNIFR